MVFVLGIYTWSLGARASTSSAIYGFSPDLGGKRWRRSEHAHASYPGLSPGLAPWTLFSPAGGPAGFNPYIDRAKKREFRDWTTLALLIGHDFETIYCGHKTCFSKIWLFVSSLISSLITYSRIEFLSFLPCNVQLYPSSPGTRKKLMVIAFNPS